MDLNVIYLGFGGSLLSGVETQALDYTLCYQYNAMYKSTGKTANT